MALIMVIYILFMQKCIFYILFLLFIIQKSLHILLELYKTASFLFITFAYKF